MIGALPGAIAHAQPSVLVRAETRIELRVHRAPEQVIVEGVLRDDRGDALPDRRVLIRVIEPESQVTRGQERLSTNTSGAITATFPLAVGRYQVRARFEGDEHHRGVEVGQMLDLDRAHVRLALSALGDERLELLDLDRPHHDLLVTATSPEGGGGLAVRLSNEIEPLASGTTDEAGRLELRIASADLGEPAAGRLVVRTEGDPRRAEAQTEVLVVRFRPTQLDLSVGPTEIEPGEGIEVRGRLSDSAGAIARRAVGVYADGLHVATLLTAEDGTFARTITLDAAEGDVRLSARYESDAPWLPSANADDVIVRVVVSQGVSFLWLLVPMVLCAAGVFWVSRRAQRALAPAAVVRSAPPGIQMADAPRRGDWRSDVSGAVLDSDDERPIADAAIVLTRGEDRLRAETDADGRFYFESVPKGSWTLNAYGVGYERRSAQLELPHRGPLAGLRVRLRSLRTAALIHYEPVAEALAPERRWWAFWTARELATRAPEATRTEIETLTEEVERAAYAEAPPSPEDVESIAERARAVEPRVGP